jgi:hypothetical protein
MNGRAVAKESRKIRRSSEGVAKAEKASGRPAAPSAAAPELADPLSGARLKSLLVRLGLPLLGAWILGALIAGVSRSTTWQIVALGVPAALTLGALGLLIWVVRQTR